MWSFQILAALAVWVGSALTAPTSSSSAQWPSQTFESEPSFHPPQLKVSKGQGKPDAGYLFFAPAAKAPQVAPLIMTDDSELVWQGQTGNSAFSFGVQQYKGEPVLVYWNGTIFPEPYGRGYGTITILDKTYSPIKTVTLPGNFVSSGAKFPSNVDLHEIYITNRNTVLVTANNVTQTDLSSVGGSKDGWIVDCLVYEIDIETNRVLFRWSVLDHVDKIPLTASVYHLGTEGFNGTTQALAWGWFHINAVAPLNDGYIISSRYTCSVIALDRQGHVLWRLSGRDGADFTQGPGTSFCYQHHIRPVYADERTYRVGPQFAASMHDNANAPIDNDTTPTSGLLLNFDTAKRHVSLGHRYQNPKNPLFSVAQGSYQRLANGNVFVDHGFLPIFEEFAADGSIVETIQFGSLAGTISYRAFRNPWIGCPAQRPALKVTKKGQTQVVVAMSWNGATEYDHWVIRAPGQDGSMRVLKTVPKAGFETQVTLPYVAKVQVEAVAIAKDCKCDNLRDYSQSTVVDAC